MDVVYHLKTLRPVVRRLWGGALDLLFPPTCVGCGEEGSYLCESCRAALPRLAEPLCPLCARPIRHDGVCVPCSRHPLHIEGIAAAFQMEGAAREMVHRLKYGNLRAIAPVMASLMVEAFNANGHSADVVIPVPLHRARERHRGYNQALLLARQAADCLDLPMEASGLSRLRDTPSQVGLEGIEARRANVAGAFQARNSLSGRRVLLVDDVCTAGATLEACALALKAVGATKVRGLVFAR